MRKRSLFVRSSNNTRSRWSGLAGLILLLGCGSVHAYDGYGDSYYRMSHPEPKYNTVYKCNDGKGNVTLSAFACPDKTKLVARQDIKVREQRWTRYSGNQDWRYSQYNRPDYSSSYGSYALRNRPNVAAINSKYREAERQAEWDGWKNKDRSVTDAKLASLEAQRKSAGNRDWLR